MALYLGTDNQGTQQYTLQEFEPTSTQKLGAAIREAWLESYGPTLSDWYEARSDDEPKLSGGEVSSMVKEWGVPFAGSRDDGVYSRRQMETLLNRQRELMAIRDVRERTPWSLGSPLRGLAMFGAGIVDPLNLATAFVPWTRMIPAMSGMRAAAYSDSLAVRTGSRAVIGGTDAGISTMALEPFYASMRRDLGDDYTAVDSLINIAFGTAFGAGVHTLGGAAGDLIRRSRTGRAAPIMPDDLRAMRENITRDIDGVEPIARADVEPQARAARVEPVIIPENVLYRSGAPVVFSPSGEIGAIADSAFVTRADLPESMPYEVDVRNPASVDEVAAIQAEVAQTINPTENQAAFDDAVVRAIEDRGFDGVRSADGGVLPLRQDQVRALTPDEVEQYRAYQSSARNTITNVSPETREAAMRAAVAQAVSSREIDVENIVGMDESLQTSTIQDVENAADRNLTTDDAADIEASQAVQRRLDEGRKYETIEDAQRQADEVEAELDSLIARGDEAYKYSRENDTTGSIGTKAQGVEAINRVMRAVEKSFGPTTQAMLARGQIQVVAKTSDIPGGPHPDDVKAATRSNGDVYIVAENVAEREIRGLVLHEVGVHVGMENMLGADLFGKLLGQLDDAIARGEAWAQSARAAVPADTPIGLVREEQLAYLVQSAPELPLVKRIIAAVRAWAYRTFGVAQKRLRLTEADYRAMAVSSLHDVARNRRAGDAGAQFAYSRGETQSPANVKAELEPYNERIARARMYANALRAASDKLQNDAQATAAMKAAMPDITAAEINELLDRLRKGVKGLRKVARSARSAIEAEGVAESMQDDAMRAANELAIELEKAEVIQKRNAALNIAARLRMESFVKQFFDSGLDMEGFRGILVGTERKRNTARMSVDAVQKGYRGELVGGMLADLNAAGLTDVFVKGSFDKDVYIALYNMGTEGDMRGIPAEAIKIAEIVQKYQTDARNMRNRFGAWIGDLKGYITRQSHDMFKIRAAGEQDWISFILPRLDIERTMGDFDGTPEQFLTRVYDNLATGSHMKPPGAEVDTVAFGTGSSLARRESVERVLHFKDGAAAYEYNQQFGVGKLADAVLHGLEHSARSAGLLRMLGTNPEANVTRVFDEYAETLRGQPERRASFLGKKKELQNLLATVDGSSNIPGNFTAAKVSAFLRSWQTMSKLGGMLISSITDLANFAADIRFTQNRNLLSGMLESAQAVASGRAKGEQLEVLSALGVFHESTLGAVYNRFDAPDLNGGKTAWAMQQFFKFTGINFWTESLRDGYVLSHSNYMAQNASRSFDAIDPSLRDMLDLYGIDAGKWEILRVAALREADGKMYMTPEGLNTVPRSMFAKYIEGAGREATDTAIENLRADIALGLRTMMIDRMDHAVLQPNARVRAFMQRGTQPGTVGGELLRFIGQFKSFPVAMIQMTLGREIYGKGFDTIGEYFRKAGMGNIMGLASFIALTIGMGYIAMSIKDLLRGKEPRPVDMWETWAAAMVQGGGLGIYGDFLFGKYNRMGGTLTGSMAGPVANLADTAADLWTRVRTGDDFAAVAFNALLQNTPFMNLFYTRAALDYLIIYQIQEALNPGYLRRMERRVERENQQTYYLPPSQFAR